MLCAPSAGTSSRAEHTVPQVISSLLVPNPTMKRRKTGIGWLKICLGTPGGRSCEDNEEEM